MARVIVSAASNINWTKSKHIDSFTEGLIRALKRNGNDVLSIRTNDFTARNIPLVRENKLAETIREYNPDLIITFNNALPYTGIIQDTDCPVVCLAADSCAFFANTDLIRTYADRYYFFNFSNDTIAPFYERFPFIDRDRVVLMGHVTDLNARELEQDINISFVGSIATWNLDFVNYFKSLHNYNIEYGKTYDENALKDAFFDELDRFKKNPHSDFHCPLPGFSPSILAPEQAAILLLTSKMRLDVLSALTDMGLSIFGVPDAYADTLVYNYDIFRCFDYTLHATMEDAETNYNRSKISLNLPHAHTKEGLSWRVCDILASNAVLLSCKQPNLVAMTEGYVDLPMYKSPAEARELAQKLLADDAWRKDLREGCQRMINDKARFEHKFKIFEDHIDGLTLLNGQDSNEGKAEFLGAEPYQYKSRVIALEYLRRSRKKAFMSTFAPNMGRVQKVMHSLKLSVYQLLRKS
jgi:hypothetical protein